MNTAFKHYFRWIVAIVFITQFGFSQSILGKWKTTDDISGKDKGIVEIYKKTECIVPGLWKFLKWSTEIRNAHFVQTKDKDKPFLGLIIVRGLRKDGDEYTGGKVLDPKIGKYYKCYVKLEEADKLKIRGYIGVTLLGRTQYWHRVKK